MPRTFAKVSPYKERFTRRTGSWLGWSRRHHPGEQRLRGHRRQQILKATGAALGEPLPGERPGRRKRAEGRENGYCPMQWPDTPDECHLLGAALPEGALVLARDHNQELREMLIIRGALAALTIAQQGIQPLPDELSIRFDDAFHHQQHA